jgi:hypothetical protein
MSIQDEQDGQDRSFIILNILFILLKTFGNAAIPWYNQSLIGVLLLGGHADIDSTNENKDCL